MKNITKIMLIASVMVCAATITITYLNNSVEFCQLTFGEVESLASCEVTKNDKVIFQCDGNEEKDCKEKYKSLITGEISIVCSGVYVNRNQ